MSPSTRGHAFRDQSQPDERTLLYSYHLDRLVVHHFPKSSVPSLSQAVPCNCQLSLGSNAQGFEIPPIFSSFASAKRK